MRALFFSLAMFVVAASVHGQDYNYTCPYSYAFDFAGLQWYDTIYLHEVYGECEESNRGDKPQHAGLYRACFHFQSMIQSSG